MSIRPRQPWRPVDAILLAGLVLFAIFAHRAPIADLLSIGWRDEEQSHVFLAPLVAAYLLWLRRARLRWIRPTGSVAGPALVLAGWLASWWGFESGVQIAWHAGALVTIVGAIVAIAGTLPLRLFAPVFLVMLFLLPVPGGIRHAVAWPLQQLATGVTHGVLELVGVGAVRSGNVLIVNGRQVAVGEACNGMRMVLALGLVVYAFAFGTPLRPAARAILLVSSPVVAVVCNVIRLVPTSLIFGYGSIETAETFHDYAGWVMLPVAFVILMALVRTIRWLELPLAPMRLAGASR